MKILVTGGAGFIGSHIVDAHVQRGDDVVVFDNLSTGKAEYVNPAARLVVGDVTTDALDVLMDAERFDAVNHHAAHMELRVSIEKPLLDAGVNVLGSVRLLEAARRTRVSQIVLASTVAVYGEQITFPADESHPVNPISPYGVSKRCMELYAAYYRAVHSLSIACLRYTVVYGPRQNPDGESGAVAIFLKKFLKGATATVHGDGEQTRDYVYVQDVVQANLLALDHRLNATYIIGAGIEVSVNQIIQMLRDEISAPCTVVHGPTKVGDARRVLGDSTLFAKTTSWKPAYTFADGVSATTLWFTTQHRMS